MNEKELLKIRSYVDDPETTGEFKYGKWGILNTEQRRTIRRLIDYVLSCEVVNNQLQQENHQLKDRIEKAINFIGPLDRESLSLMEYETLECILEILKGEENK